jgi:hypothetical protein
VYPNGAVISTVGAEHLPDRTEIREGKQYRITVLPEAIPHPKRPHTTRYRLNEVGKGGNEAKRPKNLQAGYIPKLQPTKYPFAATINGEPVTVWSDWIEHEVEEG